MMCVGLRTLGLYTLGILIRADSNVETLEPLCFSGVENCNDGASSAVPLEVEDADVAAVRLLQSSATIVVEAPPVALVVSQNLQAPPTTTHIVVDNAAEVLGAGGNHAGDLYGTVYAVVFDTFCCAGFLAVFMYMRTFYKCMYQNNCNIFPDLEEPADTWMGWYWASLDLTMDQFVKYSNLDHAMLMEYCYFAMKSMTWVGAPAIIILCPLHAIFGGGSTDSLSAIGFANVARGSWLCWVHAFAVWYVVIVVTYLIFQAQERFKERRMKWLQEMPVPRSTTCLVEGLPSGMTEKELKKKFDDIFGDAPIVSSATIVQDTSELRAKIAELDALKDKLTLDDNARKLQQETGDTSQMQSYVLSEEDKADCERQKKEIELAVSQMRKHLNSPDTAVSDRKLSSAGFVTFAHRRHCELALNLVYSADQAEYVVSVPPDPSDVIYADLLVDPNVEAVNETIGYGLLVGVFLIFLPVTTCIATFTDIQFWDSRFGWFHWFVLNIPSFVSLWDAMMGPMALTLWMSFLPTILVLIFDQFFVLKANAWMQAKIQKWYFYFLIVFVLLGTAVGSSIIQFAAKIIENPTAVFMMLAKSMPEASHFYLKYLPLQLFSHGMNITRYIQVAKYLGARVIWGEQGAVEFAEPEDQDYYGMGSRSARFSLWFTIGLVFCTLSPIIALFSIYLFFVCRLFYGFLVVYSETYKPDLGGVFWTAQLHQVFVGMVIFVALMMGVLTERSASWGPTAISASAFAFLFLAYRRFNVKFNLDTIPLKELDVFVKSGMESRKCTRSTYKQPELLET